MTIIVNADDLGFNGQVNEAICQCIDEGCITSTSLMVNGPAAKEAVQAVRCFPKCSVGVHLNVTEFTPLTNSPALRAITNSEGQFSGRIRRVSLMPGVMRAVVEEWCAQVERARALGVEVTHLDSHHMVHTIPELFLALKHTQWRCGIRKVRLTPNVYLPGATSRCVMLLKRLWIAALRHVYHTRTTVAFTSLQNYLGVVQNRIVKVPSIELMVHPGHPDFMEESRTLRTCWRQQLPFHTVLQSYREL